MKRSFFLACIMACALCAVPLQAGSRVIVRVQGGTDALTTICGVLNCTIAESIGDPQGQLFVVTSNLVDTATLIQQLLNSSGVVDCEPDLVAQAADASNGPPAALNDTTPVTYHGSTVPEGYVDQPATQILRLSYAQASLKVSGSGTVAVIDTGVDPNHPALVSVLLRGYDFTRDQNGADETQDLSLSDPPSSGSANQVNSNTYANVDQSTAAVVDGQSEYSDFGHGTMVAGIIHLVAPSALILPLKAFKSDGTGYNSDILRAIYFAVRENATVINMSFSLASYSQEIKNAIEFAHFMGVICVAAAGNNGQETLTYPAAYQGLVMGVASTTNTDQRSSFSNYGSQLVWVAAPGEGVVTTYPFGMYAAAWGTSFSAPWVSGTAALLGQMSWWCDEHDAAGSVAHAVPLGSDLGNGRLDIYQAAYAWRQQVDPD
ncbi:MAG: S8 family serine peptidase [Acidobacteriaceae bacterium]|nr:S8 family serine peptidase [Acidobacteriaceae bacterium]